MKKPRYNFENLRKNKDVPDILKAYEIDIANIKKKSRVFTRETPSEDAKRVTKESSSSAVSFQAWKTTSLILLIECDMEA